MITCPHCGCYADEDVQDGSNVLCLACGQRYWVILSTVAPDYSIKVVFLDFGGVLTIKANEYRYPTVNTIKALNMIVSVTGAQVVITSERRLTDSRIQSTLFNWGFEGKIHGVTGICNRLDNLEANRGIEIREYIEEHPEISRYVVIDDMLVMFHHANRIITNKEEGLTYQDAGLAIGILEGAK